jgi:hypothetical protein
MYILGGGWSWLTQPLSPCLSFPLVSIILYQGCARPEVLTAVVMKNSIFWDITPCSLLKVNWHFKGRVAFIFRVKEVLILLASVWFLAWLILWPWRWRQHVPLKHRVTFNKLHGIICQKTELFYQGCPTSNHWGVALYLRYLTLGHNIKHIFFSNIWTQISVLQWPDLRTKSNE